MFKRTSGLLAMALLASFFLVQAPAPATAGWWDWACFWCEPEPELPSAEELIEERSNLRNLTADEKEELEWMIEEYRYHGAPESDVEIFLDELSGEYRSGGLFRSLYNEFIIAPAHAGSLIDDILKLFGRTGPRVKNKDAHRRTTEAAKARILSRLRNRDKDGNYSNLRPEDEIAVQYGSQVRTLVRDANGRYWLQELSGKRITPSGKYAYITLPNGTIKVVRQNNRYGPHVQMSEGRKVRYAGEIRFENKGNASRGNITGWNNGSGHYKPHRFDNGNAGLPLKLFKLWNAPL